MYIYSDEYININIYINLLGVRSASESEGNSDSDDDFKKSSNSKRRNSHSSRKNNFDDIEDDDDDVFTKNGSFYSRIKIKYVEI
jgi:hypothetical protein